jgi:hypothetical protein
MRLVAEVARTTAATLMLLASSPSRLTGVEARAVGGGAFEVSWNAAVERGVTRYRIQYVGAGGQVMERMVDAGQGRPSVRLEGVAPASTVSIKAVSQQGLEGWDWARLPLTR